MPTIDELRSIRVGGYAVFDFVLAFVGVYLLSPLLSKLAIKIGLKVPKISWMYLTLPFAILVHIIVGVDTPLTNAFLDPSGSYFLKIFILLLLVLGMSGIRRTD